MMQSGTDCTYHRLRLSKKICKEIDGLQNQLKNQLGILAATHLVDTRTADNRQSIMGDTSLVGLMEYFADEDEQLVGAKHLARAPFTFEASDATPSEQRFYKFPDWPEEELMLDKTNQRLFLCDFFNILYTNLLIATAQSPLECPEKIVALPYNDYMDGNCLFKVLIPWMEESQPFFLKNPASMKKEAK